LKEEVLDRTVGRIRSGRSYVPVARNWMNTAYTYPTTDVTSMGIMYFTNLFNQYKNK